MSAKVRPGTVLLEIDVTAPTAAGAAQLATAVTDTFTQTVRDLAPLNAAGTRLVDLRTVASAAAPKSPLPRHQSRWAAIGALLGAFLGIVIAVGREACSRRVRIPEDVQRVLAAPVLGVLPRRRTATLIEVDEESPQADGLRAVRATLLASARRKGARTVVVTTLGRRPAVPLAADLGVALAEAGVPVLVTEVDLQHPVLASAFGLPNEQGLGDVLNGRARVGDVTQTAHGALRVLPAGPALARPHQLVAGRGLVDVVCEGAATGTDLTLLDADARVFPAGTGELAAYVDGVLLVVPAGRTRRRGLVEAVRAIETAGGSVLGVVLTGAGTRWRSPWSR